MKAVPKEGMREGGAEAGEGRLVGGQSRVTRRLVVR